MVMMVNRSGTYRALVILGQAAMHERCCCCGDCVACEHCPTGDCNDGVSTCYFGDCGYGTFTASGLHYADPECDSSYAATLYAGYVASPWSCQGWTNELNDDCSGSGGTCATQITVIGLW